MNRAILRRRKLGHCADLFRRQLWVHRAKPPCKSIALVRYVTAIGVAMRSTGYWVATLFCAWPASIFSAPTNSVVNLSHYDLVRPDFAAMRREGIVGVIHEATYPPFERDAKYFERQQAATRAGLLWGAYHFANGSDPVRQADHFLSAVSSAWAQADPESRPEGVLLVLDFEKNGHYPGGTMRLDQAIAFVERIRERTGKYPGIYSGEYHLNRTLNSWNRGASRLRALANCWLWLANYGAAPRASSPWDAWHLWQYCGDGRCRLPRSAYPQRVANLIRAERNIFNGSRDELRNFWREHAWQPGEKPRREPPQTVAAKN